MNEDPLFSGGVVKFALLILVVAGLGFGAYAIADGGIDLPDIDLDELDSTTTNLSDTDLSDTTIGGDPQAPPPGAGGDPFTTTAFQSALAAVKAEAGPDRKVTRLFINPVQTQFIVVDGDGIEAFSVRVSDPSTVVREEATITITGNATIDDFAFPLDAIDPAAINVMLASARKQSGASDFEPTVVSLERRIPFGDRALEWTINAEGGGRNLVYRAKPNGSDVRDQGSSPAADPTPSPAPTPAAPEVPSNVNEAQKLGECIEKAGQDTEKVFACLEKN